MTRRVIAGVEADLSRPEIGGSHVTYAMEGSTRVCPITYRGNASLNPCNGHAYAHGYGLEIFYTHIEGEAIARLYQAADDGTHGLVMNPAGFLYAGYALRDCLLSLPFPISRFI